MNSALNGSDPCTYKKVQDDNNTNSNNQTTFDASVLSLNDTRTNTNDALHSDVQQITSSSNTIGESESIKIESNSSANPTSS